ncbi:MAG: tetratricopeptide repeat protein [Flavobacterium sp.]
MKTKLFIFVLFIGLFSNAQDAQCAELTSLYNEACKNKNFEEAFPMWEKARKQCPTFSAALYQRGEQLINWKLETATDKEKWVKEYMTLLDEHDKNFPDNKKGNIVKKAMKLYDNNLGTKEEIYGLLDKAFTTDLDNFSNVKALLHYFEFYVDKFEKNEGGVTIQDVFVKYDLISDKLDAEEAIISGKLDEILKKEEAGETLIARDEKNKLAYQNNLTIFDPIRASMDAKIEKLATCDRLLPMMQKEFEGNKTNIEWLNRTANRLRNKGCTDSKLFNDISEQILVINPTANAFYNKAAAELKKGNTPKAIELFNKSIELEEDVNKKATLYYTIATSVYGSKNKPQARVYCEKALAVKPSFVKAYLYLSDLYASSANEAGNTPFEKRAVNWLAAQVARKAGEAGARKAAECEQRAPSKQDIFTEGMGGKQICFKGWIGKCITVPN